MPTTHRAYPGRKATRDGRPGVQFRDTRNEIEYWVESTEEPDSGGRYHVVNLVCSPATGGRCPDSIPHRTICEIAANVLERTQKAARGGNAYHGAPVETLRKMIEEGKTRTDIARELGRSVYTVDSWLKRARRIDPTFPGTMTKSGTRRPARNRTPYAKGAQKAS